MCSPWCREIAKESLVYWPTPQADVLEVGAFDVNGNVRSIVQTKVKSYLGTDLITGPGVDLIVKAEDLLSQFGPEKFDVVLCTEMLEHTRNWPAAICNMLAVLKIGGIFLLTTRSPGMYYHPFPEDHWRFTEEDVKVICQAQAEIISIQPDSDPQAWGIGFIARRRAGDLVQHEELLRNHPVLHIHLGIIPFTQFTTSGLPYVSSLAA